MHQLLQPPGKGVVALPDILPLSKNSPGSKGSWRRRCMIAMPSFFHPFSLTCWVVRSQWILIKSSLHSVNTGTSYSCTIGWSLRWAITFRWMVFDSSTNRTKHILLRTLYGLPFYLAWLKIIRKRQFRFQELLSRSYLSLLGRQNFPCSNWKVIDTVEKSQYACLSIEVT